MSYETGEALILSLVRSCTSFAAGNTLRSDWKALNQGKADHYAIVRPGRIEYRFITFRVYEIRYQTVIEVWQQYVKDGTSPANLYALVAYIVTGFMPERLLNQSSGYIVDAQIDSADEIEEMWRRGGGPAWLRQKVYVNWTEQVEVSSFTD